MKRSIRFLFLALFAATLAFPQTVIVKRVAKSPADLKITPWVGYVSTGLKVVGKGSTVYFMADTTGSGATAVTSIAWSIPTKPGASVAAFDTSNRMDSRFIPDVTGQYVVQASVNGGAKTAVDTIFVSTFKGNYAATGLTCGVCHSNTKTDWEGTGHSSQYKRGITGMLENSEATGFKGAYGTSCAKCHTTGWDDKADNGNFGYLAKSTGWDTTWYKPDVLVGNEIFIPYGDQTRWNTLMTSYPTVYSTATIGCESCHGAGVDHINAGGGTAADRKIGKSVDAGVCLQCHDAPTHHMVGTYWKESNHATMPLSGMEASNKSCYPCHSGAAFVKYVNNPTTPGYDVAVDNVPSISCTTCHDPHNASNPNQLRTVSAPALANGFVIPAGVGGKGQLCMNCHRNRSNSKTTVDAQVTKLGSRLYPHHSPVADMFFGQNAYDFDLASLKGVMTHEGVEDACITCHMPLRTFNADHSMKMVIDGVDKVEGCKSCHGSNLTSFEDIGSVDYDGDGVKEGTMVEIDGLMAKLKELLPVGADGEVITLSNSSTRAADSTAIVTSPYYPQVFAGIWNYSFIKEDKSHGAHNPLFAIQLLNVTYNYVKFGTVPVELTSFTGSISNGVVNLVWQTATEKNNKGFDVQRKIGTTWQTIGFVNGKGTSSEINKYSYSDNLSKINVAGKVTYRLRQVDFDGTTVFTKEVNVNFTSAPKSFSLSQNYPNPFNPSTTISYALPFDSNVKISIYKVTGELVKVLMNETKSAGTHEIKMNTAHDNVEFSSGIYFYSIEANAVDGSNTFRQTRKMILLK